MYINTYVYLFVCFFFVLHIFSVLSLVTFSKASLLKFQFCCINYPPNKINKSWTKLMPNQNRKNKKRKKTQCQLKFCVFCCSRCNTVVCFVAVAVACLPLWLDGCNGGFCCCCRSCCYCYCFCYMRNTNRGTYFRFAVCEILSSWLVCVSSGVWSNC